MALNLSTLVLELTELFDTGAHGAVNAADAGLDWSQIIVDHASTGLANGIPPSLATFEPQLAAGLANVFAPTGGKTPDHAAEDFEQELTSAWSQAVFAGMIAPPVPTGGAALVASLTSIFSTLSGTTATKASQIANAIDAYTKLVIVTFSPNNPFPVV